MGRNSKYTKELGDKLCETISTSSRGLRSICKELGVSTMSVVRWLNDDDLKDFRLQYARAKQMQADLLVDEILEIADDSRNDTEVRYDLSGEPYDVENKEWVNRSRLRVDSRKWIASKLYPKKYSEKIQTEISGTIQKVELTPEDIKKINDELESSY